MLDHDHFKKYFSEATWKRLLEIRDPQAEEEIFSRWIELFEEGHALLGEDAKGPQVQAWAHRCHEFWDRSTTGDAGIQAGYNSAWRDQQNWPAIARIPIAHLNIEKILQFASKAQSYRRMGYYDRWKQIGQI